MNTFIKDDENRSFTSIDELHDFVKSREETDVWSEPYIYELKIGGIPLNSPILIQQIRNDYPKLNATDEALQETMDTKKGGMGMLLSYPDPTSDGAVTYPLRYTAYNSLFERAGLTGKSIRNTEEKNLAKTLDPSVKAEFLNTCLALYGDTCKVLLRDGKISTVRSSKYEVLSTDKLIENLELTITCEWDDFKLAEAVACQEYLYCDYEIVDQKATNELQKILPATFNDCSLRFRFQTSDIGNSTAKIIPVIKTQGAAIPFGNGLGMKHSTGSSMDKWTKDILPRLGIMVRDMSHMIETLSKNKIKNPGSCLNNVAAKIPLPKEASMSVAEDLDSMYDECTALDIYAALYDIIKENEKKYENGYTVSQRLRLEDQAAQAIYLDYNEYDRPVSTN